MSKDALPFDQVIERVYGAVDHTGGDCRCCAHVRAELHQLRRDARGPFGSGAPAEPLQVCESRVARVTVEREGLRAALRLECLFHAQTKKKLWKARYDLAGHMLGCCDREIARRTRESEEGTDETV